MANIGGDADALTEVDAGRRELLARYVDAFERYDIDRLVTLLRADAVQSMPPYAMWLQGAEDIGRFMLGPGIGCRGSRLIPLSANGSPAFGHYKADPAGGHAPWALVVLEISGERVAGIHSFLDVEQLFPAFGLPPHLPGGVPARRAGPAHRVGPPAGGGLRARGRPVRAGRCHPCGGPPDTGPPPSRRRRDRGCPSPRGSARTPSRRATRRRSGPNG